MHRIDKEESSVYHLYMDGNGGDHHHIAALQLSPSNPTDISKNRDNKLIIYVL